jgi:hypothetical protein
MTYEDRQNAWIKENDIKVGDRVIVAHSTMEKDYDGLMYDYHFMIMENTKILHITPRGISLDTACPYLYPFDMLEKDYSNYLRPPMPKGTLIEYRGIEKTVQHDLGDRNDWGFSIVIQAKPLLLWYWKCERECKIVSWPDGKRIPKFYRDKFVTGQHLFTEEFIPGDLSSIHSDVKIKLDLTGCKGLRKPYCITNCIINTDESISQSHTKISNSKGVDSFEVIEYTDRITIRDTNSFGDTEQIGMRDRMELEIVRDTINRVLERMDKNEVV